MKRPTFKLEKEFKEKGYFVIGVDEVGCGCLAGPVIACACYLPINSRIGRLADSKLVKPAERKILFEKLLAANALFTIGIATVEEIDRLNIRQATLLAMKRAVLNFRKEFSGRKFYVLVDAWTIPGIGIHQKGIIRGDRLIKSIAAASIIAKVIRDRLMEEFDGEFKGYFFGKHKGYGTVLHKTSLRKLGPCSIHRRSFLGNI